MDFTSPLKSKNSFAHFDSTSVYITPSSGIRSSVSSFTKTPSKYSDRYIPTRTFDQSQKRNFDLKSDFIQTTDFYGNENPQNTGAQQQQPQSQQSNATIQDENTRIYNEYIQRELFFDGNQNLEVPKILRFSNTSDQKKYPNSGLCEDFEQKNDSELLSQKKRRIPQKPQKILDAPGLADDFYVDVLDWSSQGILAVALGQSVYTYNTMNGSIHKLCESRSDPLDLRQVPFQQEMGQYTSLKWESTGGLLSIGKADGNIEIWDVNRGAVVRKVQTLKQRVGCLDFCNPNLLGAGCKDKSVLIQDVRESTNRLFYGHQQEVCSIRFSPDQQFVATGGNDNKVNVWNYSIKNVPFQSHSQHKAAIRALAWNPHQHGVLVTGGGKFDQSIKVWNINQGQVVSNTATGTQICKILFSENVNQFVCSHGYEDNKISVWKFRKMEKIAQLDGHNSRVLYMSLSPDSTTVATGSGDETIKFWKIFPSQVKQSQQSQLKFTELR